jgi:phosphoglycerate kinase
MDKLTIDNIDIAGRTILVRVDFNVPLNDKQQITDDKRIVASLPTIRKIISSGGKAVLCSHLGRPKGQVVPEMSLKPVAVHLTQLLGTEVRMAPDCIGDMTAAMAEAMGNGDVLLLENLRFHKEETDNDPEFAKQLASLAEIYVNDAFGTAHRAHASTEGVTKYFDTCAAGYLMEKEIQYLGRILAEPEHPFVAVLGGAKISGKIDVIENLLNKVDRILVGGGMVFTFLKAKGLAIGDSLLEEEKVDLARETLAKAGEKLILPVDCVVAGELADDADTQVVSIDAIPDGMKGLDIGPGTIELFSAELEPVKTAVWNGPMGVFEIDKFAQGTYEMAKILAGITARGAVTIVGGGDSASAVKKAGLGEKLSHISTGGGASLKYLEGKALPGIAALTDK